MILRQRKPLVVVLGRKIRGCHIHAKQWYIDDSRDEQIPADRPRFEEEGKAIADEDTGVEILVTCSDAHVGVRAATDMSTTVLRAIIRQSN